MQRLRRRDALGELVPVQQRALQVAGRLDPLDGQLVQRPAGPRERLLAVGAPHEHLGDHRVVERDHRATRLDARVDPHARARRRVPAGDLARRGHEPLLGVLRVDAQLDRAAARDDVLLRERQRQPGRDPHLLADEVDAAQELGQPCSTWRRVFISRK